MKIKKKIKKYLKELHTKFPNVEFDYKLKFFYSYGKLVGYYSPSENRLAFNLSYVDKKFWKQYKEVVRHELGHFITRNRHGFGIQTHGKEWRRIMFLLGSVKPRAKIEFGKNSDSFKTNYEMKCKCSTHMFSKNKRTRLRNGTKYKCPKCNKKIIEIT